MKIGIVGLPQSGKTTLFRALTRGKINTDDYGNEGGRTHVGVVRVPDPRVDMLVAEHKPKKVTYASIEFIDGAARVGREDARTKFGSDFFADVRQVDALVHVIRGFTAADGEQAAPSADAQTLADEFVLADLQVVENRIERVEKQLHGVKKGATTPATIEMALLERIRGHLEQGRPLSELNLTEDDEKAVRCYDFLTLKTVIAVLNVSEEQLGSPAKASEEFRVWTDRSSVPAIELCAEIEMEVAELPDEEESEFLNSMGIEEPARDALIRECYRALGLISFFTASESEVKAWTLHKGETALDAAGTIHSDIARGFIRVEVADVEDIAAPGGWDSAKQKGKMQLLGRDYVVKDGDVLHVRFKI